MAELREAKEAKAKERAQQRSGDRLREAVEELKTIDEQIAKATEAYKNSMDVCRAAQTTEEVEKAFNKSDQAQNNLVQILHRRRMLQKLVSENGEVPESIEATGASQWHDTELGEGLDESEPESGFEITNFSEVIESELA